VVAFDVLSMNGHDFVSPNKGPETLGYSHNSRSSQKLSFGVDYSNIVFFHYCLQHCCPLMHEMELWCY
jgi:hypothetical protein